MTELIKRILLLEENKHKFAYDTNRNQKANMNLHKENEKPKRELAYLQADHCNPSLQPRCSHVCLTNPHFIFESDSPVLYVS